MFTYNLFHATKHDCVAGKIGHRIWTENWPFCFAKWRWRLQGGICCHKTPKKISQNIYLDIFRSISMCVCSGCQSDDCPIMCVVIWYGGLFSVAHVQFNLDDGILSNNADIDLDNTLTNQITMCLTTFSICKRNLMTNFDIIKRLFLLFVIVKIMHIVIINALLWYDECDTKLAKIIWHWFQTFTYVYLMMRWLIIFVLLIFTDKLLCAFDFALHQTRELQAPYSHKWVLSFYYDLWCVLLHIACWPNAENVDVCRAVDFKVKMTTLAKIFIESGIYCDDIENFVYFSMPKCWSFSKEILQFASTNTNLKNVWKSEMFI